MPYESKEASITERLKVLFITAWYPTKEQPVGGVFVQEHAKAVRLYDDVVVLHCAGADAELKRWWRMEEETDESLTEGIPTYRVWHRQLPIPLISYFIYLWSVLQAYRHIVAHGFSPDIIHAHIYEAGVPAVLLGKIFHLPVVVTEHWSAFPMRYLSRMGSLRARIAFRWANTVLPVSKALQAGIESYGIKANFQIVPNAVDTTLFYPDSRGQLVHHPKRLLFVGHLKRVKGVPYLLEALANLQQKREDWVLHIVGDGAKRAEYERMVQELGLSNQVTFHGQKYKSEVAQFMRQSDLFVLPSVWENMPCVLIEATTSGLPIVASAVGGIPEIVNDENGLLAEAMNPSSITATVDMALDRLANFDKNSIRENSCAKYSYEEVGRLFHGVYVSQIHHY